MIGLEGALLLPPLDVPEVSNMPMNPVLLERDVGQASSGIRIKLRRRVLQVSLGFRVYLNPTQGLGSGFRRRGFRF